MSNAGHTGDLIAFAVISTPLLALCLAMVYDGIREGQTDRKIRLSRHQQQLEALRRENDQLRAMLARLNAETRP